MRVTIEKVVPGAKGVWTSSIEPQRLLKLGNPIRQWGRLSIVMVSQPSFENQNQSLQFDLDSAVLLNLGNTTEAILVDSRESEPVVAKSVLQPNALTHSSGDLRFIKELGSLTEPLRKMGEQLLGEIRKEFPGELVFHEKSGKFVESPDNFWVVRIQPRAQSLRIIIYGGPRKHSTKSTIELKDDMTGYSNFVINSQGQLREAIDVIREAKQLKEHR